MPSIEDVVFTLADKFPDKEWDLEYNDINEYYYILTNDMNFYFNSNVLKNWKKILRNKYPDVKFIIAYRNFKH